MLLKTTVVILVVVCFVRSMPSRKVSKNSMRRESSVDLRGCTL